LALQGDRKGRNVASAIDKDELEARNLRTKACDFEVGGEVTALVVTPIHYNPLTGKHEWSTKPSIEIDDLNVSMGDVEKLLADNYWASKQYDYATGKLDYVGCNTDVSAGDGDTDWYIWKYTWTGENLTKVQGPRVTSWTNRASGW